jgi:hypothetical protein
MSERRPGVPRLRHGVGVGVGHFCAEGTVHGPIVSRSHASWTQNFGKKRTQKLWHTAGWESRAGDTRRCACYGYAVAEKILLRACMPHAHRGGGPVFLTQLSSTDDCSCPLAPRRCWTLSLSHTAMMMPFNCSYTNKNENGVCISQRVCSSSQRQPSSPVYNGCRESGTMAKVSGGLRANSIAPSTTNHGCNFAPMPLLPTMVCKRGAICTPFTNHGCTRGAKGCNLHPFYKPWFVKGCQ